MRSKLQKQKQILTLLNSKAIKKPLPKDAQTEKLAEAVRETKGPQTAEEGASDRLMQQVFYFQRSIIQNIHAGLVTVDMDGEITFANKIAARLVGYEPGDLPGRNFKFFFKSMEEGEKFFKLCAQPGKRVDNWESVFIRQNRKEIRIGIDASHFEDTANHYHGIVCLLRDLTEVHQMRQQLRRMEHLALLGELSAGIAHEVRNPLAGIKAASQLLEAELTPEGLQGELITRIVREVDKANRLLKDFFRFARPAKPEPDFHAFSQILKNVFWLVEPRLKKAQIRYEENIQKGLGRVYADGAQVEQVLLNLMFNAIDAMEGGGVLTINVHSKRMLPIKTNRKDYGILNQLFEYIIIEVKDAGSGIAPENLDKVFNPFFTTKSDGLGLGLSICNRLVEENKGKIDVVSHKDQGTSFILALPAFMR